MGTELKLDELHQHFMGEITLKDLQDVSFENWDQLVASLTHWISEKETLDLHDAKFIVWFANMLGIHHYYKLWGRISLLKLETHEAGKSNFHLERIINALKTRMVNFFSQDGRMV